MNTTAPSSGELVPSFLTAVDLDLAARGRFSSLSDDDKNKACVCILCDKRLKVLKARGVLPMVPVAPRKQSSIKKIKEAIKFPRKLIRELQRLAAFQCQVYIFTQCEKN